MDNNNSFVSTNVTLKIIVCVSIVFVILDIYQVYAIISSIPIYYERLNDLALFNRCVKYQSITDISFALFGVMTGLSAVVLSLGMIYDTYYFTNVIFDTYLHFNYILFGPFLLFVCLLGFYMFDSISYVCDSKNFNVRYVNFTTVMSLLFMSSLSLVVTVVFTVVNSIDLFMKSVRFEGEGSYLLGKMFWYYVLNYRGGEVQNINLNVGNINNNRPQGVINNDFYNNNNVIYNNI